ncbi:MAG: TraB/VirB10 family protein [Bdellovibrionaceae bacterium]|nr:TraB/VirB10 family protein [Pseudobdellovibrionaceae bacterium]
MQTSDVITQIRSFDWKKHEARLKEFTQQKPILVGLAVVGLLLIVNMIGLGGNSETRVMERGTNIDFQKGRILNDRESTFYYGKERLLSQKAQSMIEGQTKLEARLVELEKKLQEAQSQGAVQAKSDAGAAADVGKDQNPGIAPANAVQGGSETPLQLYEMPEGYQGGAATPLRSRGRSRGASAKGPDLIAFPVKSENKAEGVMLPAGSYVKAKILTGVDVPEGKTYPVLMVLDFSYVAPNDHKIDLSGCFMIAKAEGDLSTERVQMQATKMSCVSKKGKMFEREVNGFIADDKDGSFAMKGKVNSKQGRVAAMAFMAGVVEGVGKAVQAAQSTQSTNAFGGGTSIMTGDSTKYAIAGGASNAAGMVAQWYLQQAQNLAPTVEVGSGRDVWIVMKDKVNLPEEFFRKERMDGNESIYSYFTRVLE